MPSALSLSKNFDSALNDSAELVKGVGVDFYAKSLFSFYHIGREKLCSFCFEHL